MSIFQEMLIPPKMVFTCEKCSENFGVQLKYFKNKESIECPSCTQPLNKEVFDDIKTAIVHLDAAIVKLRKLQGKNNRLLPELGEKCGFSFHIEWNEHAVGATDGLFD